MSLLDTLPAAIAPAGLNHVGVFRPDEELRARVHPGARSVVVVGSGGRAHWDAFLRWVGEDPRRRLAQSRHPLDDFTAEVFARLPLSGCRVVHPTFHAQVFLDFMKLGERAGLGRKSELGILVSERFGPWFALRAAVFTPEELPESPPARRMCDGCPAPCLDDLPPGLPMPALHPPARVACVVGREHLYDELERTYHTDRKSGRRLLCERFGVGDEVPPGEIR